MAITKLMHIKENSHLYNNIKYILDEKKTKAGQLVGGNAGSEAIEIYNNFMDTKIDFEKTDGRKGYHFVISFKPGEVDEETAYKVVEDFCKAYLGENYDYVFVIHTDQAHIHGHITFNSVSRTTGYKYRYVKGDWLKSIQPITDKVSKNYNLSELTYTEKRKGVHYAEWKKGGWKTVLKLDIDYAISKSSSWEEFQNNMLKQGYTMRGGFSKKNNKEYVSYSIPGANRNRRDYTLGKGYVREEIESRILEKDIAYKPNVAPKLIKAYANGYKNILPRYQVRKVQRLFRAKNYHNIKSVNISAAAVRKDLSEIDKLYSECKYILGNSIKSEEELQKRFVSVDTHLAALYQRRKTLRGYSKTSTMREYFSLVRNLNTIDDERIDNVMERLRELEQEIEYHFTEDDLKDLEQEICSIANEKKIITRILDEDRKGPSLKPVKSINNRR
ncbi:hypothetical protein M2454_000786 [Aequitasia blattaphilus]|uniref:Relaxase/mobilization nuclease domain-containing protein n=1 Tax=Aequitasia blattaphilus TaxID=2949332 RepID=A0ABT1E844_9FIRM|nr:relaxase/mobilization nuclease domain-containing protein [Aequitasia blattaphilus]MCP1101993.1 relaxase/mobilization nuclease domain-containing protein [Aequitasia blattaphilus]MCR8614633.1 relaxase/mobilization nuclease domain-containing protein [Aequitasia blattaphilus]